MMLRMRNKIAVRKLAPLAADAGLQAHLSAEASHARRKDPFLNRLGDDKSSKDAIAAVRGMLGEHNARVVELFRQWDKDGSGTIELHEMQRWCAFL